MIVSAGKPDKDQRVDIENYNFHFDCKATKVLDVILLKLHILASVTRLTTKKGNDFFSSYVLLMFVLKLFIKISV